MSRYLASRAVQTVVTLALMSFVVYLLIGLMPGDPIDLMIAGDPKMTSADAARSSGLPARPQVVLYVDIHSTIPVIGRLGSGRIPASVVRNLKPLRSAVEYAVSRFHEIQVSFFLHIQ